MSAQVLNNGIFGMEEVDDIIPKPFIIKLFDSANKAIIMSSEFNPIFYKGEVGDALKRAIERRVKVRLLLDNSVDWANRKEELPWVSSLIEEYDFKVKKSEKKVPHLIIIDGEHIRLEKPHNEGTIKTKNTILYNTGHANDKAVNIVVSSIISTIKQWWHSSTVI